MYTLNLFSFAFVSLYLFIRNFKVFNSPGNFFDLPISLLRVFIEIDKLITTKALKKLRKVKYNITLKALVIIFFVT